MNFDEKTWAVPVLTSTIPSNNWSFYNADGNTNCSVFDLIDKTVQCVFKPSLFFVGAPTNILNMIVFCRQGLRDRMNLCLFCLALVDLVYVTAVFSAVTYCFVGLVRPDLEQVSRWTATKYSLHFIYGFLYSSGCVTMIIAVERCLCVLYPLRASTMISTKKMAIILGATVTLINALSSVYAVKESVAFTKDARTGATVVTMVYTDLFLKYQFFSVIENIVLFFVSLLNFVAVSLATSVTVITLQRALLWRQNTASSQLQGQAVLMRMLVAVACVYIVCAAPMTALALTRFAIPEFRGDGLLRNAYVTAHTSGSALLMANSSLSFFVYITLSSRFRRELVKFLGCNKLASHGSVSRSSVADNYK